MVSQRSFEGVPWWMQQHKCHGSNRVAPFRLSFGHPPYIRFFIFFFI
jgi:hypothetical protein